LGGFLADKKKTGASDSQPVALHFHLFFAEDNLILFRIKIRNTVSPSTYSPESRATIEDFQHIFAAPV
jgi:hypothetical protein